MKEDESTNKEKGISWGHVYSEINFDSPSSSDYDEIDFDVVLDKILDEELKMDTDNSLINEVDSVQDGSNKLGLLEPYLSETTISNMINFKSNSEDSVDNSDLPVFYENQEDQGLKTDYSNGNLHIVENTEFNHDFDPSPLLFSPKTAMNETKISSRTLLTDYADPKDSLDKMWDIKSLLQEIKTDYNYPKPESEVKFEEDFKNNYLHTLNTKRSEPSSSSSSPMMPAEDTVDRVTVDIYKFELEKLQKIVKVLKGQIVNRDAQISRLNEKVLEYDRWRSELEPNRQASLVQYKAENEAVIAVNFAKLQAQVAENESLTHRLMQMEEQLRQKDDEIKSLRERLTENELTSSRFDRDLKSLQIDKQMLKNSIQGIEKTFRQREMQLKLSLDMEYQNQLANVLKEHEQLATLVSDKDTEIEKCKQLLKTAQHECTQLLNSILKLKEVLLKKNQEVEYYKDKVIELESQLITNDKTSELKVAKETQNRLRETVRQLEKKLEMLQESNKVQSRVKEENLYLKARLEKLESGNTRDHFSQSVLELGNQMVPLSLVNFKDAN